MIRVQDLCVTTVPSFHDAMGTLVALEGNVDLPIAISRVFMVSGGVGVTRGKHAHKQLTQAMVCVYGVCVVKCDDGVETKEFVLDASDRILTIPPGIWAEQKYSEKGTVLMVLCDLPYDESDYIRNYEKFIAFRREQKS